MKKQLCRKYGYYTPKTDSHKEENFKSRSTSYTEMLQFVRIRKGVIRRSLN